jgi:uncharacterized protein (PEP-CTERM system associated)
LAQETPPAPEPAPGTENEPAPGAEGQPAPEGEGQLVPGAGNGAENGLGYGLGYGTLPEAEPSEIEPFGPEFPLPAEMPPPEAGGPLTPSWKLTPSLAGYGSYTSNATLAPPGHAKSDFFTTITPSLSVDGNTARLRFNLDYSLQAIAYAHNSNLDDLYNHLDLTSTAALAPELLYVDARATVQQYPNVGPSKVSGSSLAASSNLSTVTTFSLSPYLRHHFGSFADSEVRYTFNQSTSGGASTGGSTLPNSFSNRVTGTLISGSEFKRLLWTLTADGSSTIYSGTGSDSESRPNSSTALGLAETEYRLNRRYGLLASLGYERIDDPTLTVEPDGPIGSVGLHWTPGPRTSVILNLNHRYDDNFVTGSANYQIGPKTRVSASYTEQIFTSQTLFANDLNFLVTDEFGNFVDARTAQLFALGGSAFGLTDQAFKLKRFDANLHGVRGRNTLDAIGYYETRDVESTGEFDTAGGGSLNWGRELSRLATLNLTLRFLDADYDISGATQHQQTVGAGASLVYHMNDTLDGIANLEYTRQFSDVADNEFSEAVISFGLAKRF